MNESQVQRSAKAALNKGAKFWVYRNSIKALPWFRSVRKLLEDPAYASWFLKFGPPTVNGSTYHQPPCDANYHPPKCSHLYHDQTQTPHYPAVINVDGLCPSTGCDVGTIPIGEYLFDFRSLNVSVNGQTLEEWFIDEYLFGPLGGGSPLVSGFFFDDGWMGDGGPSEIERHSIVDMNLTHDERMYITRNSSKLMQRVNQEVIARGAFSWQGLRGSSVGAYQPWVHNESCDADLRRFCTQRYQNDTMFYGFWPGPSQNKGIWQQPANLGSSPMFKQDLANFLLIRSPYAWIGHGWLGTGPCKGQCNSNEDHTPYNYTFPEALNDDYGVPLGICAEVGGNGTWIYPHYCWLEFACEMNENEKYQ